MMKLFAALVALVGLGVAVAIVFGGGRATDHPVTPLTVASPADSFIVHDAPPPAATPAPAVPPAAPGPTTPDAPTQATLDAAIERLRAAGGAKPDTPATPVTPTVTPPAATATADPSAAATPVAPPAPAAPAPPPPPSWTAVTAQGVRWRTGRDPAIPAVVIDMGGGRTATVFVDPAFMALPQGGANSRVDFLKQTILESFPPGSSQFRFARDGSVSLLR
jgi:hypothetical protein